MRERGGRVWEREAGCGSGEAGCGKREAGCGSGEAGCGSGEAGCRRGRVAEQGEKPKQINAHSGARAESG